MGEMIEGFGDEVVLFAAFLALSLVFLSLLTCTRRQRSPDRAESTQEGENHAHVQQPAEEEGQGHRPEAHSDSAQFSPGADGLRHRTPLASTAGSHQQRGSGQLSGDREQPSNNSGQLPDWQHRGGDVRQSNPQPGGSNEQEPSDSGGGPEPLRPKVKLISDCMCCTHRHLAVPEKVRSTSQLWDWCG